MRKSKYFTKKDFTEGYIPGRVPLESNFYSIDYYSGKKKHLGVQYPIDGSYLDPESKTKYKFIDLIKWVGNYIKKGRILDIGAGPGHFAYWAQKMGKDYAIDSCDISPDIREYKKYHGNHYTNCNASHLGFDDLTFEATLLFDVIEHMYPLEAEQSIKESYRILKHKGYIFIRVPNRDTWSKTTWKDQAHVWLPSTEELKKLVVSVGFQEKSIKIITRGFPFSQFFYRITKRDLRLGFFGTSIMLVAQKS